MRSLFGYFLLTYLVSWSCFGAAAAFTGGFTSPSPVVAGLAGLIYLLGVFAPALVALALTARTGGRKDVLALLGRILQSHVGLRWYLFAAGYMALIKLAVALLYRAVTNEWPRLGHNPWYLILIGIVISTPVQAGEEIGWRGYALPRLEARLGLAKASIVLGVIWASWHLPFFFIPGVDKSGQSFPVYLLSVTALSVAAAWLYWRTDASLLLVMLLHSAVNQTSGIVPATVTAATNPFALSTSLVAWLTVGLQWIGAVYFLVQMRKASLGARTSNAPPESRF